MSHEFSGPLKIDRLRIFYIRNNISLSFISSCKCDGRGSSNLQCREDGSCECKSNVDGNLCSSCKKPGFYNLDKTNPSGCLNCFCFNKTIKCQSADGFRLTDTLFLPSDWLRNNPVLLPGNSGRELHFHFTSNVYVITLPSSYYGNKLYLLGQTVFITAKILPNIATSSSNNIEVILRFIDGANKVAEFKFEDFQSGITSTKNLVMCTSCELNLIPLWRLQGILANVVKIELHFESQVGSYGIVYDFKMHQVEKNSMLKISGDSFGGFESCNCPKNFSGSSCEACAKGEYHFLTSHLTTF